MASLKIGQKARIPFKDDYNYILDVEVTEVLSSEKSKGRVVRICSDLLQLTGGEVFDQLHGKEITFENADVLFMGKLTGKNGSADCNVKVDADSASVVKDVNPPLPEGDYQLSVNGLIFDVQHIGDEWIAGGIT
jgi:hypothetical protein